MADSALSQRSSLDEVRRKVLGALNVFARDVRFSGDHSKLDDVVGSILAMRTALDSLPPETSPCDPTLRDVKTKFMHLLHIHSE